MLWAIIVILVVSIDQIVKHVITTNLTVGALKQVIPNFFYITHYENTGIAWSLMSNSRYIIIGITSVVAVAIGYYLFKSDKTIIKISLSLILGGAIGNLIDRIFTGSVTDFLEFHFGSYTFPVFNAADICIVTGAVIFCYYLLFLYKEA